MFVIILFIFPILTNCVESARILGVYPFPAHSHYQLGDRLFKELARRGHDVTVISPYKEKAPINNFKQILVEDFIKKSEAMKSSLFDQIYYSLPRKIFWMDGMGNTYAEMTLNHTNVQNLLKQNQHFDLVIFHQFMTDSYNGFCYHFKAPCIAVTSMTTTSFTNRKVGNPGPPSYVPQLFVNYPAQMNFFQRFYNTIAYVIAELSHHLYSRPYQNKLLQKYFPNAPHLDDLYYNTSLILVNSHVSINDVKPLVPNIIDIGGYHVKEAKELTGELKEYLDNAKDGVIYFSMGSNLKSKDMPIRTRDAILKVFSKLKQKVLWKWEDENLPNKPDNVKISSWFPQSDVLNHPNVVLFITHGGLLSTIEAVYFAVPVLGIPVFSDQGLNMARAELAGYGKYINYGDFSEERFEAALNELLHNPRYAENAKQRSFIMHDQPLKPLDNAMYWIEYVIRHKGAPHLRLAAVDLNWYQYFLLDVIVAALVALLLIVYIMKIIFNKLCSMLCSKKRSKVQNKKKKH